MEHVAIDLGSRHSQICVRAPDSSIMLERKISSEELSEWLKSRAPSRVILETCSEAFAVADTAMEAGHEVRVVPTILTKQLGVGHRKLKNDVRDARVLSEASCRTELPSVHVPSQQSRLLKSICTSRDSLVSSRTKLVNRVRGELRCLRVKIRRGKSATLPQRVREALAGQHDASLAHLEPVLEMISFLNGQVKKLDELVRRSAQEHPICKLMMTIPGVGPVTAVRFVAAIDDPRRFPSGNEVASYFGLTPGENTTGFKTQRTGITKAGPKAVRWTLVQAAWCLYRVRPNDNIVRWAVKVEGRGCRPKAIIALARKLCTVMFAMWRDGSPYQPQRVTALNQEAERTTAELREVVTQ